MSLIKNPYGFKIISSYPSMYEKNYIFNKWARDNIKDLRELHTIYKRFLPNNSLSFNIFVNYIYNTIHSYSI